LAGRSEPSRRNGFQTRRRKIWSWQTLQGEPESSLSGVAGVRHTHPIILYLILICRKGGGLRDPKGESASCLKISPRYFPFPLPTPYSPSTLKYWRVSVSFTLAERGGGVAKIPRLALERLQCTNSATLFAQGARGKSGRLVVWRAPGEKGRQRDGLNGRAGAVLCVVGFALLRFVAKRFSVYSP
jgi:hypothetical protein